MLIFHYLQLQRVGDLPGGLLPLSGKAVGVELFITGTSALLFPRYPICDIHAWLQSENQSEWLQSENQSDTSIPDSSRASGAWTAPEAKQLNLSPATPMSLMVQLIKGVWEGLGFL